MKIGITQKLFIAIFMAASLAVVSATLIMQWNLNLSMHKLVLQIEKSGMSLLTSKLEMEYAKEQGWGFLKNNPHNWRRLVDSSFPELKPHPPEEERLLPPPQDRPYMIPPHIAHQFTDRFFLLDADKKLILGMDLNNREDNKEKEIIALKNKEIIIGYLGLHPQNTLDNLIPMGFLHEQRNAVVVIAAFVLVLSAILAYLLALRLIRPLKKITEATHVLAQGEYSVRVPVESYDELGKLASDFNALALVMEHNESSRRRWVADISHELRTPLTFLRSQVEAIQDGVRQPTTESIQAIHQEIMRFTRLVDDLYQLSISDVGAQTYQKDEVELYAIIHQAIMMIGSEFVAKNINLKCDRPLVSSLVYGDRERLRQLFGNLLVNSLKYTDEGGELRIDVTNQGGKVVVDFQDSAPGVPATELDKLFESFYRVDSSRNRATGGAGLGLAICRNIVKAHEGTIVAKPSALGGVWIRVEIPSYGRGV